MAITTIETAQWVSTAPMIRLTLEPIAENPLNITYELKVYYVSQYAASTNGVARKWSVTFDGVTKSGTYNINGVTGTRLIYTGENIVRKVHSAAKKSATVSMEFNLTWSGTYGGTKSKSGSVTIPVLTSYKVSYNANGGSGAPGVQTKWHNEALKISTVKPSRTGYTFQGWATSSSGGVSYAAGANYTANAAITLYAVWKANTWTVSYNANGGSGAPGAQTKTYGVTLKLSTATPTRTNYTFQGWATSSSGGVSYAAGANYTANAAITLYAVWALAYQVPRVNNLVVQRCNSSGTVDENGTYAKVTFSWATDKTVSSIKVDWKLSTSASFGTATSVSASGTSGNVSVVVGAGDMAIDYSYDIRVTVADASGNSAVIRNLGTVRYVIDIMNGGNGIAFGKAANTSDLFDVGYRSSFDKNVTFKSEAKFNSYVRDRFGMLDQNGLVSHNWDSPIDPNTTLDHIILTNKNTPMPGGNKLMYIHTYWYATKNTTTNRMQVAYPYDTKGSIYHRYYYNGAWAAWRRISNADEFDDYLVQVLFDKDNISIKSGGHLGVNIPVSKSGYKCIGVTGLYITNASSDGVGSGKARLTQFYANTGSSVVRVDVANDYHSTSKLRIRGNALFYKIPT